MKKWFYVLFPTALIGIFLIFYLSSRSETLAREAHQREEAATAKAEADKKKAEAEATAQADAERRNVQRANEEAKAAKDKEDKYNTEMAKIKAQTDGANATADKYAKEVSDLTIELDNLHKQKDTLTRESFELLKKIELSEVARRNAELEIQRYDEMIANRADQSILTKMPPAPPPEKS
jgi:translation initiation factor IF-2